RDKTTKFMKNSETPHPEIRDPEGGLLWAQPWWVLGDGLLRSGLWAPIYSPEALQREQRSAGAGAGDGGTKRRQMDPAAENPSTTRFREYLRIRSVQPEPDY
ncbi:hypothetical protein GDO81_025401, partial [Engystomops pustulosus]